MRDSTRVLFVDNLRTLLCLLVVFNHSTEAYGTGGWWYYQSAGKAPLIVPYTLIRAFYMMLFFMISGYFLPAAYDRKGAKAFIKDRLQRLGIPLLIFFLLVIPIMMYVYYVSFRGYGPISFWTYYLDIYFGFGEQPPGWTGPAWPDFQFGHLWFLQHLLILDLAYVLWRALRKRFPGRMRALLSPPGHWSILALIAALAGVTFFVRITHPIHRWIGILDFIQTMMSDLPRDWCFFVIGVIAYRNDWFRRFPTARTKTWLRTGLAAMALFSILALLGEFSFVPGGYSWQAAVYALWETTVGCGLCIGLPVLF
ncbi:MAG: acyltransferase family protein, partial [Anaerolineae bacterium]